MNYQSLKSKVDSILPELKISAQLYEPNYKGLYGNTQHILFARKDGSSEQAIKSVADEFASSATNIADRRDYLYGLYEAIVKTLEEGKQEISEFQLEEIVKNIKTKPEIEFDAFVALKGVRNDSENPIKLGTFTVGKRKWNDLIIECPEKSCFWKYIDDATEEEEEGNLYVHFKVKAKTINTARIVAKDKCKLFENILLYMLADCFNNTFGNVEGRMSKLPVKDNLILFKCGKEEACIELIVENPEAPISDSRIDISNQELTNAIMGYDWIWKLTTKSKQELSEIEKDVISAIRWMGEAARNSNNNMSLVQIIFGLETLLITKEKDQMITPSIAYQLSEAAAFIGGGSQEERIDIEKSVKKLWRRRSQIVHGGSESADIIEIYEATALVKKIIGSLIIKIKENGINTKDDIRDWVKKTKYSNSQTL